MKHCPKCGAKLHLKDWRPECPKCGVNMVYYKSNEILLEESEKTEIEHAKFQPKVDRAKAAFFGSTPAIIRIVLSLLPIAGLFLPICNLVNLEGNCATQKSINIIGAYNYISQRYNPLGNVFTSLLKGDMLAISIVTLMISLIMILVCLICLVMSLGKHGKIRNLILNSFMLLNACVSAVCFGVMTKHIAAPFEVGSESFTSCSLGAGIFVYIGLILVLLIYNLVLAKVGLKINYTPCLIGGLPSEEYFEYVEQGMSQLEIRKKMVEVLTKMQEEVRAKEAEAQQKALEDARKRK